MKKNEFIHLHVHTEYSLLDGAAPIAKLIEKAKELNMPAIALTDHGNLYGAIKFYDKCLEEGIKPILGCECYIVEDMLRKGTSNPAADRTNDHIVLLAKTNKGFKNLSKLVSLSSLHGQYYGRPRIDINLLKEYSEDLICLTACIAGTIPRLILQNNFEGALEHASLLKSIFANGDFYIELQDHGLNEQKRINPFLIKIAKELGIKCVATNDVHYINREDWEMHDVLLCIQTKKDINDPDRMRFPNDQFYLKSREEMEKVFNWIPEAIETTHEIADKCDVSFKYHEYQIPEYPCPDDQSPEEYLRKITYKGLEKKLGKNLSDEYLARIEEELNVIISMGYANYYLTVWDFVAWAKEQKIPVGPGRGSGVGSLVAYAMDIISVNPMKYGLLFERFLNKDRMSMPDFDIDFCENNRGKVLDHIKEQYTEDRISNIIAFSTMQKRAAIKNVAKVFNIEYKDVNEMTKAITQEKNTSIQDLLNPHSEYKADALIEKYNQDALFKKVLDNSMKLEGMPCNTTIHAAGIVIYKEKAIDTIPITKNSDGIITTQFDLAEIEKLGLIKMDLLSLVTLTDINDAISNIMNTHSINVDFSNMELNDPNVFEMIANADTDGVFQLGNPGMKQLMRDLKPTNLEDIIAGISLYRPGPMRNKDIFLSNRNNPEKVIYKHPQLEVILKPTSGVMLYQEQAMLAARKLAGYSMTQADNFRSIISKKKVDQVPIEKQRFIYGDRDENGELVLNKDGRPSTPGCIENGIKKEVAEDIFEDLARFADYAFNKSHAVAYAYLAYQTAYLKLYYPIDYMSAVVNNRMSNPIDIKKFMQVLKKMNITVLPPDINISDVKFKPEGNSIRYGLGSIKNISIQAINDYIVEPRKSDGNFASFQDFLTRVDSSFLKSNAIESLIYAGAFDCFGDTRRSLITHYPCMIENIKMERKATENGQFCISDFIVEDTGFNLPKLPEFPKQYLLQKELEVLKMYISGHPLAGFEEHFSKFIFNTSMLPTETEKPSSSEDEDSEKEQDEGLEEENSEETELFDNMPITTGGIIIKSEIRSVKGGHSELAIIELEDLYDRIPVIVYRQTLQTCRNLLKQDSIIEIEGHLSIKEKKYQVIARKITPLSIVDEHTYQLDDENNPLALCLSIEEEDIMKYNRILDILKTNPGMSNVYMQYQNNLYPVPAKIGDLERALETIQNILGPNKVKILKDIWRKNN